MVKVISIVAMGLLLTSILAIPSKIQLAQANQTIYIRADGSIDPPGAAILSFDDTTYTIIADINDSIVIEKDDIVLDGAGCTVQGTGTPYSTGISMMGRTNVTIANMTIMAFNKGIAFAACSKITIIQNNVTASGGHGIELFDSSYNTISRNNLTSNTGAGVWVGWSSDWNTLDDNSVAANQYGIVLASCSNNTFARNTFTDDGLVVMDSHRNYVYGNTVNEKPLLYLEGVSGYTATDAGQVILVNCDNIQVENLKTSNTTVGVELWGTNNSRIVANSLWANTHYGVEVHVSLNNTIAENNITECGSAGVFVDSSASNILTGNSIAHSPIGILLDISMGNNVVGNNITGCQHGVRLHGSSKFNSIIENNITASMRDGIRFDECLHNDIAGNIITSSGRGIYLKSSSDSNQIFANAFNSNDYAIWLENASNNKFRHNNFVDYTPQIYVGIGSYYNVWDDGYPSGGNYWRYYGGSDIQSGPFQNETGGDGIGDRPRIIDTSNTDGYPLMAPLSTFYVGTWSSIAYDVDVVSNSSISEFQFNPDMRLVSFNVSGEIGEKGFCRVTIPMGLLWTENGNWTVLVGSELITDYGLTSDENSTYLYFVYSHSTKTVQVKGVHVVTELPSMLISLLFPAFTLLAIVCKKRQSSKRTNN